MDGLEHCDLFHSSNIGGSVNTELVLSMVLLDFLYFLYLILVSLSESSKPVYSGNYGEELKLSFKFLYI